MKSSSAFGSSFFGSSFTAARETVRFGAEGITGVVVVVLRFGGAAGTTGVAGEADAADLWRGGAMGSVGGIAGDVCTLLMSTSTSATFCLRFNSWSNSEERSKPYFFVSSFGFS